MNQNYRIHSYRSVGKLHISILGEFNGMCAWALFKMLRQQSQGAFRIFVNTAGLDEITPEGAALFKSNMVRRPLPADWLYFKGNAGFRIAPDGSRVLICKKGERCKRSPNDKPIVGATGTVSIQSRPPRTTRRLRRT